MTHADLGRQLKAVHPVYKDIPDAELGRRLQLKYPGFYGHATADMDSGTIPEAPKTLRLQLQQLSDGLRRLVFVPRGSKLKIPMPAGMRRMTLPSGDYFYDPKAIKPAEILAAVKNHELNEILGSAERGYGAPSKENLQGEPMAVVSRDAEGETAHGALTDQAHMPEATQVAEELKPEGGSISIEPPHVEIEHRKQFGRGRRWPKAPISR